MSIKQEQKSIFNLLSLPRLVVGLKAIGNTEFLTDFKENSEQKESEKNLSSNLLDDITGFSYLQKRFLCLENRFFVLQNSFFG